MKSFDFSHWDLTESSKGLLFFAQSLEEMLFHYGHDSLKVPALNFRFLCIEISNTIKKIDAEIVDKGNMRPLFEELKDSFGRDPIAKQLFGIEFDSLFFAKNADGEIQRNCSDILKDPSTEASIKRIKRVIDYLLNEMEINDSYYSALKAAITEATKSTPFTIIQQEQLYQLSRILLTELINCSYSQEYIYLVVKDIFYNKHRQINNVDSALELFWSHFDFEEKAYTVILPLKLSALKKHLSHFQNISVKDNDNKLFGNSCKWIIELTVNAMDPYNAHSNAKSLIGFFVSLLQYNNHRSQSYSADQAVVTLKDTDKIYNLQTPITPLKRGNVLSDEKNNEKIALMVNNFSFSPGKLVNVIELHSSAINSTDIGNQLLNLWTIVEVLVPTEPKNNFCKINQICNTMTSVLNAQYVSSLIVQLLTDLQHCIPDAISGELAKITKGNNDIEKITAILVLPEYQTERTNILNALNCYPLLQYRVGHYSTVFSDRGRIKSFLVAHRKRLSWHIMRIYRNRNMIVHDGSHFPYIDIIVQNLHHYVDVLIDTINLYTGSGYPSINTTYTTLQQKEYRYLLSLEKKGTDGALKKIDADFAEVVLGYLN